MCLNTGTPKKNNFSLETNGKLMALGVPILKHFRVFPFFVRFITIAVIPLFYEMVNRDRAD